AAGAQAEAQREAGETEREGAPAPGATVQPVSQDTIAAPAPAEAPQPREAPAAGPPAPDRDIATWHAGITARIHDSTTPRIGSSAQAGQRVRTRGSQAVAARSGRSRNAAQEAQAAVPAPPRVDAPLPPADEDPVPQSTARLHDMADRQMPDQSLPQIQAL